VAIKPAINPGVAVAERPATLSGAMNFISGGQTLGTSIVASAANKIVGFQRGAAAVAPKAPDLGSIINTLSTNILSNVENKLQSVNQNIQQVIQNKFISQLGEYRNKIQELSSNPPNKILQNFFSLYKEAIGYIQFLGNRKNIKRLGDNLQALQNVFSETFKIAALVRTTIIKIVNQLSNLPTASSGPGGLNMDINVPGGPLRRGLPGGKVGNMLKMAGMGAAVAGAGALGSKVVSGMMDVGGDVQPDTTGVSSSIPTPLLDRFMEVLNRFDNALKNFQAPQKAPSAPSAPTGGAKQPEDKKNPGGPGGGVNAGDIKADTAEEKAFIATVREAEGTAGPQGYNTFFGGSQYGGDLSGKTVTEVKQLQEKFKAEGKGRFYDRGAGKWRDSAAVGAGQFLYPEQIVREMGMDPDKVKFTPELQNQMILYLAKKKRGVDVSKELTATDFKILQKEWSGLGSYYGQGGDLGRTGKIYAENLKEARSQVKATGGPGEDAAKIEAQIRASTDKSQTMKGIAGEVAQPAIPSDQQSNVSIVPLVMGSPQTNSTRSGTQMAASAMMSGGVTAPFLSSSNEDNFFTILSKVVYNIVDG
jgi:hypothetical protein